MSWTVSLDPISSADKCKIELENNLDLIVLEDILFGDVWFCSGQSNMGWSMLGKHFLTLLLLFVIICFFTTFLYLKV